MGNKNSSSVKFHTAKSAFENKLGAQQRGDYGLKWKGQSQSGSIPIKSIHVDGKIVDSICSLVLVQNYYNDMKDPIEAIFEFPTKSKDQEIVVNGLVIEVEDKAPIYGKVQEKQKAFDTYDDAIASGHGAYLMESKKVNDVEIVSLSVGALPPKKAIKVTLSIVLELNSSFVERKSPDLLSFAFPEYLFPSSAFEFSMNFSVRISNGIKKLEVSKSIKSNAKVRLPSNETDSGTVVLSKMSDMPSEMTFEVTMAKPFEPFCVVEEYHNEIQSPKEKNKNIDKSLAFLLNFQPSWEQLDEDLIIPVSEIIFLIDRSGSMSGQKMNQVKSTMLLFMKSLPESVKFNIIGFGSNSSWLFPESVHYTEQNLSVALSHIERLEADLGGTELLGPLKEIFQSPSDMEYPRQLFILTDGEVDNREDTIKKAEIEAKSTRIFTLGIGEADQILVNGLARAGNGFADFIKSGEAGMEAKVMAQLKRALEPTLRAITVDWGEAFGEKLPVKQGPFLVRPVFNGEKMTITGLVENIPGDFKLEDGYEVKLKGVGPDGEERSYSLPLNLQRKIKGNSIHTITARKLVTDLEDRKSRLHVSPDGKPLPNITNSGIFPEIVRLGLKYQIITSQTSMVAVEERDEATEGTMQQVKINQVQPEPVPQIEKEIRGGGRMSGRGRSNHISQRRSSINNMSTHSSISSSLARNSSRDEDMENVMREVEEVKNMMISNIESVLERNDKLDDLMFKSEELEEKIMEFSKKSSSVSKKKKDKRSDSNSFLPAPASAPAPASPMYSSMSPMAPSGGSPLRSSPSGKKSGVSGIASHQKINGSWNIESVQQLTQVEVSKLKSLVDSSPLKVDDADLLNLLWATALVLNLLEIHFSSTKNEWDLLAQKAKKWMKREIASKKITSPESTSTTDVWLLEQAKKFVQSEKLKVA